jgi:1-acyl-sn-glycerol-3-phosphate acyltransferase
MNDVLATRSADASAQAELDALREATLFQRFCYGCVRVGGSFIFSYGFGYRSRGWRHVPKHGPVLLVANHQSFFDPVIVGMATPRHLSYLARKTLFRNRFFAWAIRTLQAVPVDQESTGIDGIRAVLRLLRAGKAVLIFPEGNRTPDGRMQPLQAGIQLLIKRSGAPVVPVGIAGAFDAWPRSRKVPALAPVFLPCQTNTIACVIGPPIDTKALGEQSREEQLETLFARIADVQREAERLRGFQRIEKDPQVGDQS